MKCAKHEIQTERKRKQYINKARRRYSTKVQKYRKKERKEERNK
jgi:hypothetical protein